MRSNYDPTRRADLREEIRALTNPMSHFGLIAKRTTGRYHWENSFTPQQRQEFTDLFPPNFSATTT
ncbi:MAG: ABC transporter substrate-binding protein [Deltaproteobacteria bacterium]|nr:ABC transporter substrate-binding protein [Deltaproteobacteria bacterium]